MPNTTETTAPRITTIGACEGIDHLPRGVYTVQYYRDGKATAAMDMGASADYVRRAVARLGQDEGLEARCDSIPGRPGIRAGLTSHEPPHGCSRRAVTYESTSGRATICRAHDNVEARDKLLGSSNPGVYFADHHHDGRCDAV